MVVGPGGIEVVFFLMVERHSSKQIFPSCLFGLSAKPTQQTVFYAAVIYIFLVLIPLIS